MEENIIMKHKHKRNHMVECGKESEKKHYVYDIIVNMPLYELCYFYSCQLTPLACAAVQFVFINDI